MIEWWSGYSVTFLIINKTKRSKNMKNWKKNWKRLLEKFLYSRQKWHMHQWRLISKTAWKVIHSSQNWFQKLISTHFSATHMSPLPVQTSIYTTRWAIIKANKKAISILKLHFIFTAPYQVTTNLPQVVSWSARLKK